MDEHMYLTDGRTVTFRGGFADHNLDDLTFFMAWCRKFRRKRRPLSIPALPMLLQSSMLTG